MLTLEALEDRRVMSAGGLFSILQPLGIAGPTHSPLSSTLSSLVAVPSSVLTQVSATVGSLVASAPGGATKAPVVDVSLNLNVDVLFVHTENLRLDVAINPIGSDQPLLSLGVGGKVAVGSAADTLLSLPQLQVGLGGSDIATASVGAQVTTPGGSVVEINTGATAGVAGSGVTTSVNGSGVSETITAPPGGGTIALAPPAEAPMASSVPQTAAVGNAAAATSVPITATPLFGATSAAPILNAPNVTSPILNAPNVTSLDGGGASAVDAVAVTVPVENVAVADVVARPVELGGGTEPGMVLVNPDLESSGLATRFQPYSLDAGLTLGSLLTHGGPQTGWLAAWLASLSRMTPWLIGLIAAGGALEIRRRRRRSRAARGANA